MIPPAAMDPDAGGMSCAVPGNGQVDCKFSGVAIDRQRYQLPYSYL